MKFSFAELNNNILTRKFGGTSVGIAEPYVTGTHFIWFTKVPPKLIDYTVNMNSGISSEEEVKNILAASCLSVTPPGGTLNKIEFTGLGGIRWSVPGNIDYGNSVSVKFLEFMNTPIFDIMHGWVKMIRDYRTGVSSLVAGDSGEGYSKKAYAGTMLYFTTAPDAETIQYYACYDGVFPTRDPQDMMGSDVESVGRLDIEIEFNVDYTWHEPWVKERCKNLISSLRKSKETVENYRPVS
jgi:hypothetical protein